MCPVRNVIYVSGRSKASAGDEKKPGRISRSSVRQSRSTPSDSIESINQIDLV
jgi:hypothetical protein